MKITLEFLNKFNVCSEEIKFVTKKDLIGLEAVDFIKKLISYNKLQWANCITVRGLCDIDRISYAVFAAEQVIDIFENKYPDDDIPRKAIEVAKCYIINLSSVVADVAYTAAEATRVVADVADDIAAAYAARATVYTARATVYTAAEATHATARAADAAALAAAYAAYAAHDTGAEMFLKIIKNGIKLLKESTK